MLVPAFAKVIYVDDNATEGGDGFSWVNAHKYLQDALAVAEYGDEIRVAEGTYKPDQGAGQTEGDQTASFYLANGVNMYGGFVGTESNRTQLGDNNQTILSGEIFEHHTFWSFDVVMIIDLDANITLDGFRITKGKIGVSFSNSNSLNLNNCIFTNNFANGGGFGVYSSSDSNTLNLNDCIFAKNHGGILFRSNSMSLANCIFTNNHGAGGISSSSNSVSLTNCAFTNNSSQDKGGGITSFSDSLSILDCNFSGNFSAGTSGGIYIVSNSSSIADCIFTNNRGEEGAGGIYIVSNSSSIADCIFTNNSSRRKGGGIYSSSNSFSGSFSLTNCAFINNQARDGGGGIYSSANSLSLADCNFTNNSDQMSIAEGGGGGGIYFNSPFPSNSLILTNCNFANNSSAGNGGGICSDTVFWTSSNSNSISLSNCIFSYNNASKGGGIYSDSDSSLFDSFDITNCVFADNSSTGDGGGISSSSNSLSLTNCIFTNNSSGNGGIIKTLSNSSVNSLTLTNCIIVKNSSEREGGVIDFSFTRPTLTNCTLWQNSTQGVLGHGLSDWSTFLFRSVTIEEAVEAEYPGDPNSRDAVYEPNLNILLGWQGDSRAFDADPLFVDIDNPIGPDGLWFTEDDGLRVISDSPAIDAGYNGSLPKDSSDLDMDENITETIPYDVLNRTRRVGTKVDIGAYEFDPANPPPIVKKALSLIGGSGGKADGGGYFEVGTETIISATPSAGYVFSNWSGDASGSINPLAVTMDSEKSITANFAQDSNDDDNDGLTNFEELVTYSTDPSKKDTDNDSIMDAREIEIGSDPNISNFAVFNLGKSTVTNDPASYSLVSKSAYDQALLDANESAEQAIADARVSAKAEGENFVTSNPSAYDLVTKSAYDQMVDDMIKAQSANATHYTEGWFYLPNRGWMWTNHSSYPYFYDAEDKDWMYFQSGEEKPRFYRYKTKTWLTIE